MYFPDDVWRYIVWLSLPLVPVWKRQYSNTMAELDEFIIRQPIILRMEHGILCVARQIVFRGHQMGFRRTLLEHAYLNI